MIACVKCELSGGGGRQGGMNSSDVVFSRCRRERSLMRIIETLERFLTPIQDFQELLIGNSSDPTDG